MSMEPADPALADPVATCTLPEAASAAPLESESEPDMPALDTPERRTTHPDAPSLEAGDDDTYTLPDDDEVPAPESSEIVPPVNLVSDVCPEERRRWPPAAADDDPANI
jgi:hypothetical protein